MFYREINEGNLSEIEIDTRMSKDRTTCCANRKRLTINKPTVAPQKIAPKQPQQKKRSVSPVSNGPPQKKVNTEKVFPASALLGGGTSAPKPATSNSGNRSGLSSDLICTPDIMSMFMDDDPVAIQKTPLPRPPVANPPPLTTIRQYVGPVGQQQNSSNQFVRPQQFAALQQSMPMVLNQQQVLQQVQPRAGGRFRKLVAVTV